MVIDNPEDFRVKVGQAQMEGVKFLTVTEKLFNYYCKSADDYFTYGEPGIKVYKEGTREKSETKDSRTAEQAMNDR